MDEVGEIDFDLSEWVVLDDDVEGDEEIIDNDEEKLTEGGLEGDKLKASNDALKKSEPNLPGSGIKISAELAGRAQIIRESKIKTKPVLLNISTKQDVESVTTTNQPNTVKNSSTQQLHAADKNCTQVKALEAKTTSAVSLKNPKGNVSAQSKNKNVISPSVSGNTTLSATASPKQNAAKQMAAKTAVNNQPKNTNVDSSKAKESPSSTNIQINVVSPESKTVAEKINLSQDVNVSPSSLVNADKIAFVKAESVDASTKTVDTCTSVKYSHSTCAETTMTITLSAPVKTANTSETVVIKTTPDVMSSITECRVVLCPLPFSMSAFVVDAENSCAAPPKCKTSVTSRTNTPTVQAFVSSNIATSTFKPIVSSSAATPTAKLFVSSSTTTPTSKLIVSSSVAISSAKPFVSSNIATLTSKPIVSSSAATPTAKPFASSSTNTPTSKLIVSSSVAISSAKPFVSSNIATPTSKPIVSSSAATPTSSAKPIVSSSTTTSTVVKTSICSTTGTPTAKTSVSSNVPTTTSKTIIISSTTISTVQTAVIFSCATPVMAIVSSNDTYAAARSNDVLTKFSLSTASCSQVNASVSFNNAPSMVKTSTHSSNVTPTASSVIRTSVHSSTATPTETVMINMTSRITASKEVPSVTKSSTDTFKSFSSTDTVVKSETIDASISNPRNTESADLNITSLSHKSAPKTFIPCVSPTKPTSAKTVIPKNEISTSPSTKPISLSKTNSDEIPPKPSVVAKTNVNTSSPILIKIAPAPTASTKAASNTKPASIKTSSIPAASSSKPLMKTNAAKSQNVTPELSMKGPLYINEGTPTVKSTDLSRIDSQSLAAVMMTVEKTNSIFTGQDSDGKKTSKSVKKEIDKKLDIAPSTLKRDTPFLNAESVKKKAKWEEKNALSSAEGINPEKTKFTIDNSLSEANAPNLIKPLEENSGSTKFCKKIIVEENSQTVLKSTNLNNNTKSTDPKSPAVNMSKPAVKATGKRIVHRYHRTTQTIIKPVESKLQQCNLPPQPTQDVSLQAGTADRPQWQDEIRYFKALPKSVLPDTFKIISEFNLNKGSQRNIFSANCKYGISIGHLSTDNIMKTFFKDILLKADYYNLLCNGPEKCVVDLFLNDEETFTNTLTQIRKRRIGARYLIMTVVMNLDVEQTDKDVPLTSVRGTVIFDQNFITSEFIILSKAPAWNKPKADEIVSAHNIPGGVPLDFLKTLIPDALTIESDDKTSKFTQTGRRVLLGFAKKQGKHALKLFTQLYINNELVTLSLGQLMTAQVPELSDIESAKNAWLLETEQKFPECTIGIKELVTVPRDINEGRPSVMPSDEKNSLLHFFTAADESKMAVVIEKSDVGGESKMALTTSTRDLSDISDASNMDNDFDVIAKSTTPPKRKPLSKKMATKKAAEGGKPILKASFKSKPKFSAHKSIKGSKTASTKIKSMTRNTDKVGTFLDRKKNEAGATSTEIKSLHKSSSVQSCRSADRSRYPRDHMSPTDRSSRRKDSSHHSGEDRGSIRSRVYDSHDISRKWNDDRRAKSPLERNAPYHRSDILKRPRDRSEEKSGSKADEAKRLRKNSGCGSLDNSLDLGRSRTPPRSAQLVGSSGGRPFKERMRDWSRSPVKHSYRGRSISPLRGSPLKLRTEVKRALSPIRRVVIRKSLSPVRHPRSPASYGRERKHFTPEHLTRQGDRGDDAMLSRGLSPVSVGDDMDFASSLPRNQQGILLEKSQRHSHEVLMEGVWLGASDDFRKVLSTSPGMKNLGSAWAEGHPELKSSTTNMDRESNLTASRDLLTKIMEKLKAANDSGQRSDSSLSKAIEVSAQFLNRLNNMKAGQSSSDHKAAAKQGESSSDYRPRATERLDPGNLPHKAQEVFPIGNQPPKPKEVFPIGSHDIQPPCHNQEAFQPANYSNQHNRNLISVTNFGVSQPAMKRFPGQLPSRLLNASLLPPPIPPPLAPPLFNNMFSQQNRMTQMEALAKQLASDIQKHQQQQGLPRWNGPPTPNAFPILGAPNQGSNNFGNFLNLIQQQQQHLVTPQHNPAVRQSDMGQPNLGQPNLGQPNMGQPNLGQANMGQPNLGQANMGQPNLGQANRGQLNTQGMNSGWPHGNFF